MASLRAARHRPGANVYAELGSTWFCLIRRPEEAAHVLGKLLLAVGEDNVLWGTDSIWYGSPQPAIDAFRAFQIPAELRERYGYPELTPRVKAKILGAQRGARLRDRPRRGARARRERRARLAARRDAGGRRARRAGAGLRRGGEPIARPARIQRVPRGESSGDSRRGRTPPGNSFPAGTSRLTR